MPCVEMEPTIIPNHRSLGVHKLTSDMNSCHCTGCNVFNDDQLVKFDHLNILLRRNIHDTIM